MLFQAQFLDIICFNRYNSWYSDSGITELITPYVVEEAQNWFDKFQKPIIMSEYGADAFPGLHTVRCFRPLLPNSQNLSCFLFQYPEMTWGEEYQVKVLEEHFKAFDELRNRGFFIGEMVWNFADFKTGPSAYFLTDKLTCHKCCSI